MPRRHLPPASLELSPAEMREIVGLAMDRIVPWVDGLPTQPAQDMDGARRLARALAEPLPEQGASARRVLSVLFERVLPTALNTAGPGYLGYIPGGGLFATAVAELVGAATNRYVGIWAAAPGLVQLETNVIRWLADLVGLPPGSGGVLTSGGSMANLGAVVTARHTRLGPAFADGVLYVSTQAHHSVRKAARIAGFPDSAVREVPVDAQFRMDLGALAARIREDRAAGLRPFLVVSAAGTTATGAVDPLGGIGDLCAREGLWHHVDAAYGGAFLLTARGQAALAGIERADSITLDPHKGLFLPYGTGCLLVRDRAALREAHRVEAAYLPDAEEDPDRWDFADMSAELSRSPRGLRVWLPLKLHGAAAFRAALDEKLDLAADAAARVAALPGVTMVAPPMLSLFVFRVAPPGVTDEATIDSFGRRVLAHVNAGKKVFLSGTTVNGRHVIRVCVLSFRTHRDRIDVLVDELARVIRKLSVE